ncbi:hypothetical protein J3R83DRAFT_1105 [Lanmaoa asiatica]|nr:hypothetical protein J3R83DRAFT_1105 [Lanmaoa asiatica]
MILSKRVQRSPPHISYPINSELAPFFSSPELLASPPTTPPRGHKHSLSKPMTWLNRSSSSSSTHSIRHAAPKPTRISEPKVGSSLEQFNFHRSGPLGSGATIVRTPQEALSGSPRAFELINEEEGVKGDILLHDTEKDESRLLPPLPPSPPLPPLPGIPDAEVDRLSVGSMSRPFVRPSSASPLVRFPNSRSSTLFFTAYITSTLPWSFSFNTCPSS